MNRNGIDKIIASTYLTSHQAAGLIQANPSSVNKWVKEGRIPAYRTPGGHRRIQAADFVAFLTAHAMPVPTQLADISPSAPRAAKQARKK